MIELYKDVDALGINDTKKINVRSDFWWNERDTCKQVVFAAFLHYEIHSGPSKFVRAAF